MSATASRVLTVRDAQILQLLREGVTRDRVHAIGLYRRSWTADDIRRVTTHWLPDGRPRNLTVVPDDGQATIPPPRTPGQRTPGLRDLVIDLLSDPDVIARLKVILQPAAEPKPPAPIVVLSPRCVEVLQGIQDGLSNKGIGARLFIAEDTVKTYVRQVFAALGVRTRLEAGMLLSSGQVQIVSGRNGEIGR